MIVQFRQLGDKPSCVVYGAYGFSCDIEQPKFRQEPSQAATKSCGGFSFVLSLAPTPVRFLFSLDEMGRSNCAAHEG
jgi:hypothetical protein